MIIPQEAFLQNPTAYPGAVILPKERYDKLEQLELDEALARGLDDLAGGRFYTKDEFFMRMERRRAGLSNR